MVHFCSAPWPNVTPPLTLVEGFETELGYFDLTDLSEVTVFGGVHAVERDLYWKPEASAGHGPERGQSAWPPRRCTSDQSNRRLAVSPRGGMLLVTGPSPSVGRPTSAAIPGACVRMRVLVVANERPGQRELVRQLRREDICYPIETKTSDTHGPWNCNPVEI